VQAGNDVILRFTLPKETVDRRPLKLLPGIEFYRTIRPVGFTAPANSSAPQLILTIPPAMVDQYSDQGHIRTVDPLKSENFRLDQEEIAEYMVRTRASAKKESADSNSVTLHLYPAADPITDLKVENTRSGILLTWTPPQKTLIGSTPTIANYHVYRAELDMAVTSTANTPENSKQKAPLLKIGETEAATYQDTLAELGKTYRYSVRSAARYPNGVIESGDSNLASVTLIDIFPPAAPQGLVVVFVPAVGEAPAHLELSWAINSETDIAGYNVYRSEQDRTPGTRLNPELLLTPAFRDMNAVPGRRYLYTVTAVDRSGNESPASAAAPGGVPVENQATP
jgi:fibronectin type 3 domain-containing protein